MPINLPTQPTGYQFEEAVASTVRSIGYFTENRTILDYAGREVLELDVVASPASDGFLNRILVDAKKDTTGFGDIFKIFGWRTFLRIPSGCVVHGSAMEDSALAAFKEVCPKLQVYANHFDLGAPTSFEAIPLINTGADDKLRRAVASVGWYQLISDRLAFEDFHKIRKANPEEKLFLRVRQYRRACHLAFFEPDPLKRVLILYSAFQKDPGISGACVDWQASKSHKSADGIWEAIRDTADQPWIQHVLTLEARARVLIIKNGIEAGLLGIMKASFLPKNFRIGFELASKSPNRTRIPYILQLYSELFGGFIIDDTDRAQLATLAGAPVDAVTETLDLFDIFYPTPNGWRTSSKEIQMTKMTPAYLRGIGSFFRQESRSLEKYSSVAPKMAWLISKWHNAAYQLLEKELAVKR